MNYQSENELYIIEETQLKKTTSFVRRINQTLLAGKFETTVNNSAKKLKI